MPMKDMRMKSGIKMKREMTTRREGKKGQVTTFIIVGIMLLILIALAIFLRGRLTEQAFEKAAQAPPLPSDIAPINNYVELCLQRSITPGVFLLGAQGGFITPERDALKTQNAVIAYGAIDGKTTLPEMEKVELQLAEYTEDAISLCLLNFSQFREQGYTIETGKPTAAVRVIEDTIAVNLDYPLNVRKGNTSYALRFFSAKVPIRLGHVLTIANDIAELIGKDPNRVDFRSLSNYDVSISVLPYDGESIIYTIHDSNSTVDDAPFTFMMATKDTTKNTPPQLDFIGNIVTRTGLPTSLRATAIDKENDYLAFYTDDERFLIDAETGAMNVTLTTDGVYRVTIGVRDTKGLADEQEVGIVVENE